LQICGVPGAIRAAYPFSARPTVHVVDIDGGASVYAMCAVDALGMSAMLRRRVVIHSAEPDTGAPITVAVHSRRSTWSPRTTVVVVGATRSATVCNPPGEGPDGGDAAAHLGAAADISCDVMNFFTGPGGAAGWLAVHPEISGEVLSRKQALRLGIALFGHLLDR
jgi:Alkylmercury lyase